MKKVFLGMILISVSILATEGSAIFAKCAGCHGTSGEKNALGKSNVISLMKKEDILADLKEYKAGTLNRHGMGSLMKGQTATLSDEDMETVSEYITTLKK